MNSKGILKIIMWFGIGLFLGIIWVILKNVICLIAPSTSPIFQFFDKYIFLWILIIIAIILFVTFVVLLYKEFVFTSFVNKELNEKGYTPALKEKLIKRRKSYENKKYSLLYLQPTVNLVNGALIHGNKEEAWSYIEDLNLSEMCTEKKIMSGTASKDDISAFLILSDVLADYYMEVENEEMCRDILGDVVHFSEVYKASSTGLQYLVAEIMSMGFIGAGDLEDADKQLRIMEEAHNNSIANLSGTMLRIVYAYKEGTLTLERLDELSKKATKLAENCKCKAYFKESVRCYYERYKGLI